MADVFLSRKIHLQSPLLHNASHCTAANYEDVKIAMSSLTPVAGRLSQMFSPRTCIFVSSLLFSIGLLVTSVAPSFESFLVGRVITGIGAAGVMTVSIILVLELTSGKRRGLFVGLVNSGYITGVSLGAFIAGALEPKIGWVRRAFPLSF